MLLVLVVIPGFTTASTRRGVVVGGVWIVKFSRFGRPALHIVDRDWDVYRVFATFQCALGVLLLLTVLLVGVLVVVVRAGMRGYPSIFFSTFAASVRVPLCRRRRRRGRS